METPKITVDQKVIVALAVIALVVSYAVYLENRKLKKQLNDRSEMNDAWLQGFEDVAIPTEEGTLKPEDVNPPADLDADLMKENRAD